MRNRKYDKDFKLDCVKYCAEHPELNQAKAAKNLNVPEQTLNRWLVNSKKLGGIATVKDIYDLNKEPTFLNYTNIVSDAVSFIPEIGSPMSIAISGCCELINKGVNLGLDVEAPILKREIMMNNTNMSTNILNFEISNTDVKILMNNTFRTFFKE